VSFSSVTATEAARLLAEAGYAYVDVRSVAEFELGHVAGAFNVPLQAPEFLELVSAVASAHAGVIVGCQTGVRSKTACTLLTQEGLVHVVEQGSGFAGRRDAFGQLLEPGWQQLGLPVTYDAALGHSYRELCEADAG
jgi:arsenate reductase